MNDVTTILEAIDRGDRSAAGELLPLVYKELRRLASRKLAMLSAGHTLQGTELVHDVWLRLAGNGQAQFAGRMHFFAAAAEAMRHILIDSVRRKQALRHGGNQQRQEFDNLEIAAPADEEEFLEVHEVLDKLAEEAPQKAEVVKLRYFVGMTFEETAEVMGISVATAKRHWAYARAWLYEEIQSKKKN